MLQFAKGFIRIACALSLGIVSYQAHALKCVGYVSVDGGEFMCAGWKDQFGCEENHASCIPIPPPRPPSQPGGGIPRGPGGGEPPLTPGEMSCKQLSDQINAQNNIIQQLRDTRQQIQNELAIAERNLSDTGKLGEPALNDAKNDFDHACNLAAQLPEPICVERPTKPPICRDGLTAAQRNIQKQCTTNRGVYYGLVRSRDQFLNAQRMNQATLASAEQKLNIAQSNLRKLKAAQRDKNCSN